MERIGCAQYARWIGQPRRFTVIGEARPGKRRFFCRTSRLLPQAPLQQGRIMAVAGGREENGEKESIHK